MSDSIGMPFLLGCCCVNVFLARNIVRYHYRIKPIDKYPSFTDSFSECVLPWSSFFFTQTFPIFKICQCAAYIAVGIQLQKEVKGRKGDQKGNQSYMTSYHPFVEVNQQVDNSNHFISGGLQHVEMHHRDIEKHREEYHYYI